MSDLVIHSARGNHLTCSGVRRTWAPAMERIGPEGVTPHDLRHTLGSRLYAAGPDMLTLSRLLGHVDATITMRICVHALPGAQLPDIDALVGGTHEGHNTPGYHRTRRPADRR